MPHRRFVPLLRATAALLAFGLSAGSAANGFAQGCFLKAQETFGMTRACIYDCYGQQMRRTISSNSICPLTTGDTDLAPSPWRYGPGPATPEPSREAGSAGAAQPGAVPPTSLGQPQTSLPTNLPTTPSPPAGAR